MWNSHRLLHPTEDTTRIQDALSKVAPGARAGPAWQSKTRMPRSPSSSPCITSRVIWHTTAFFESFLMSPSPHPSTGPFNSVFKIDLRSAHVSLSPLSPLYSNGLSLLDQCNSFISEWSSFHLPPTHSPSNGECDHIKIKTESTLSPTENISMAFHCIYITFNSLL